jgi:phenylalanyl-tRNA synthetase beta chain
MLCSQAELQVGEDSSGLWVLPREAPSGQRVDEALSLRDWVLAFDLTPNRSDCLSVLGLAFEVAAVVNSPVRIPDIPLREEGRPIAERFHISIRDPDLCPRYVARLVEGARVAASPLWMRRRLQLVGIRPINNLVDVTNYVMWELGQPLHAFDGDLLEEAQIVVQRARPGERFVSLDGQPRMLRDEMLMIWDGRKPVAVAGVMGGQNSEVGDTTRNVLIESAYFDPMNIRRTAKALNMATEASRRFERGIDLEGCPRAADRAAQLMSQTAGGRVASGLLDVYPRPRSPEPIVLRVSRVNRFLGTRLRATTVREVLERLGLRVQDEGPGEFRVLPPSRRVDLTREVDLAEEVARVYGFERISATLPPRSTVSDLRGGDRSIESRVREIMVGFGFHEMIGYSFIDALALSRLGFPPGERLTEAMALRNPIRQDQGVMRTTLLPGMLDVSRRNLNRKNTDLRLFELGKVFLPRGEDELPDEPRRVGGVMMGSRHPAHWAGSESHVDFFDLKGVVQGLLNALHIGDARFVEEGAPPFLSPSCSARIELEARPIGWVGEIGARVKDYWELDATFYAFEMDFETLARLGGKTPRFRSLPRFPEVVRDLSVVVREDVPAGSLLDAIADMRLTWFQEAMLIDVFQEGEKVGLGHRSLTFRIRYRSAEGSLTDEAVNEQQTRLMEHLRGAFDARLRA